MAKKQAKKRIIYSKLTRGITGMTQAQYDKAYKTFASRVRNYNKIAGTHYQAAKEFYYSFRYPHAPSPALKNIMKTVTTHAHYAGEVMPVGKAERQKTEKAAVKVFEKKWSGWLETGRAQAGTFGASRAEAIFDLLKSGTITYQEADMEMRALADERRTTSKGNNFVY